MPGYEAASFNFKISFGESGARAGAIRFREGRTVIKDALARIATKEEGGWYFMTIATVAIIIRIISATWLEHS